MTARSARTLAAIVLAAALVFLTVGCASTSNGPSDGAIDVVTPPTTVRVGPTTTTVPKKDPECLDAEPTRSYSPRGATAPGPMPAGTPMGDIQTERQVRVGVDENTIGFSYRDPDSGDLVGFEADLAREAVRAIFGPEVRVLLVTLTTPEKIEKVANGEVDMTVSVVTINCTRWYDVDFSTPYYSAFQQLMVRGDSTITRQADLAGKRVCVTERSSSESFLKSAIPDARRRPVATRTECLTRLQEGTVDAIVLPSSIMAGLAQQDQTMKVFPNALMNEKGEFATNIYGIAVRKTPDHEFARSLNALLEQWRVDGTIQRLQAENLERGFTENLRQAAPGATYRD